MRVAVSFDSERGYYTTAPDVPTVTALSLAGVRKRIAAALMPDEVDIKLELDRAARRERDRRRAPPLAQPGRDAGGRVLGEEKVKPVRFPPGRRRVGTSPGLDRIGDGGKDNRNGRGGLLERSKCSAHATNRHSEAGVRVSMLRPRLR